MHMHIDRVFQRHEQVTEVLDIPAETLFDRLDDQKRFGAHMQKPSAMMFGASMTYRFDEELGQRVGSVITMQGSVLGMSLAVEEIVVERARPARKVWITRGDPKLVIIGCYRMGFVIDDISAGSRLTVFIDYDLPNHPLQRILGILLGQIYARWCIRRVLIDARN